MPTLSEVELLASLGDGDDPKAAMFDAAIAVLYVSGAKADEVIKLKWIDRRPWGADGMVLLFEGGTRSVPVLEAATSSLKLHERSSPPRHLSDPMFMVGAFVLTLDALNRELGHRSRIIGLTVNVTASAFRVARVRDLTDEGMTIEAVADLIGLRDLNSVTRILSVLRDMPIIPRSRKSGKR